MELVVVYEGPPHSADAIAGLLRQEGIATDYVPPAPYLAGPMLGARVRVAAADHDRAMDILLHSELDAAERSANERVGGGPAPVDDETDWEDDDERMPPRVPAWIRWVAVCFVGGYLLVRLVAWAASARMR